MAVYTPIKNECKLDFGAQGVFYLPLHEDFAAKIDEEYSKIKALSPTDKQGIDEAYNAVLDVIDGLVGEGAADSIMETYEKPGVLEAMHVLAFIADTWKEEYSAVVARMKQTTPNRAERRARR